MSNRKRKAILAALTALVSGFSIWNISDFCRADRHSTAAWLAVIFNVYAVIALARLIRKEAARHE